MVGMQMSQNKFINVMISSRNSVVFDGKELSSIRSEIKRRIETTEIFWKKLFKVWINEDEPTQSFDNTIWEKCLAHSRKADIIICLNCKESGWIREKDSIGICHAELLAAINVARSKVWVITLNNIVSDKRNEKEKKSDKKFNDFIKQQELFSVPVNNFVELISSIDSLMRDAILSLMQKGVIEASRGKGNNGETLSWKRMNYDKRSSVIVKTLNDAITFDDVGHEENKQYYLDFEYEEKGKNIKKSVNVVVHSIPDALSIANARERVGQPFLDDFRNYKKINKDSIGPIHIIGCHKTVSESQARNILGFPDATILKDSFGIYVADNIQKIQMVFIEKCSDSTSTSMALQEFLNWLVRTNELRKFIKRAESRKKIIHIISEENEK